MNTDSIFKSALRSFFKAFFTASGFLLGLFLIFSVFIPFQDKLSTEMTILPDLNGNNKQVSSTAPVVLQINIHGVIGANSNLNAENLRTELLETRSKTFFKKDRVKAILLNINTPGGTVIDSDTIYSLLKSYKARYKIPVYAYVEGLCASGGLYIASAADKIYSSPVSTIGSVGVLIGPFFNLYKLLDKIGIESLTLSEGKNKDLFSPFRVWKENESESLKPMAAYIYERFVNIITENRPLVSKEKLINEYGAKVFAAPEAQKLGFIDDSSGSYETALKALLKQAGIDEEKPYQIVQLKTKKPWINEFMSESFLFKNKITHEIDLGPMAKLESSLAYLYLPQGF